MVFPLVFFIVLCQYIDMKCVFCSSTNTSTTNSRSTRSQTQTWRRKHCKKCKRVFTTFEKPDMKHLAITKDNSASPYHRSQLYMSIAQSFQGNNRDYSLIDMLVDTVEIKLLKQKDTTIASKELARLTLATIKPIDKKAYLHYLAEHS